MNLFGFNDFGSEKVRNQISEDFRILKEHLCNFPETEIKKAIDLNTKIGWALTANMDILTYRKALGLTSPSQVNKLFYEYYTNDDLINLKIEFDEIKTRIPNEFKSLVFQCISCFLRGDWHITIPSLITIVEGLIAKFLKTNKHSSYLLSHWEKKINPKENELTYALSVSLHEYIGNSLFTYKSFKDDRGEGLNRNWILHGRDTPDSWEDVDSIKLFILISALLFIFEQNEKIK
ncbi:hypothetical protein FO507_00800 [Bacillus mojavensis]|uniref:hypothetical protein n=1 Tax=Bacillus mojavensis TaxID=72360 RepID=UPI00028A281A|nr:hypothetical protein [Bacillus mojavensis]MDR4225929.1 hypothetical protein [Bacillus mojavensis]MEC3588608.1 hypothetical protein [Bacillus mojavensis]MEC5245359.1 hypothetical protein [Bacillus mojavensis]MED0748714.1 hypothetical protein [Bacillus mojavensis]